MLSAGHAKRCQDRKNGSDEDGSSTADPIVDRIRDPSRAIGVSALVKSRSMQDLQECNGNIRARIDEADDPGVLLSVRVRLVVFESRSIWNSKVLWKAQVGTVGAGLVPALNSGSDGIQDDGEVQNLGMLPAMENLVT